MTYNVSQQELRDMIYEDTESLGIVSADNLAERLLAKYDVTAKPEPVGTVRVAYDVTGHDSAVFVKVAGGADDWAAIYFGHDYARPAVYNTGRPPVGPTGRVFVPPPSSS